MKIQEILFPQVGRCTEEDLYFRKVKSCRPETLGDADYVLTKAAELAENQKLVTYYGGGTNAFGGEGCAGSADGGRLCMEKGGRAWFDTYFNGFSIDKWRKYTVLTNLSLVLRLAGKFRVRLCCEEKVFDNIFGTVLVEKIVEAREGEELLFEFPEGSGKGMCYFELEALGDGCVLYGGSYLSDLPGEKQRDVTIGIGICTFRREAYVEKNLEILRKGILENPDSPMYGHLEVFVSDNGKTLDVDRLQTEQIRIFPNRNLGGAGGFTRDLIEMNRARTKRPITHALLMDDDVVIEPEAIVKTWTLLTLLKEEYVDAFIGGAMLRLDQPSIQMESGAVWNGGMLDSLKSGLDLRYLSCCLYNEHEETTEFNAWWYCCFPLKVAREDNLPLPIFIRGDDLEYGLRNMKTLILMNGICVWHEPFEYKYSSFLEYYIIRNQLIDNAFHCPWYGAKQLKKAAMTHCKQEIMFYRYKNVDLYIRGIEDFLRGPQWLMKQDGEALHKDIMASGYRAVELKELDMPFHYPTLDRNIQLQDTKKARIKRILTLNGLLLPARGETIVPVASLRSVMFYRKKRVMHYDVSSRKAFLTAKSNKEAWRCIFKTLKINRQISRRLAQAQKAYREEGQKLRTLEFWKTYLGI